MKTAPSDNLCINCSLSVLLAKPAWCPEHTTWTAYEFRLRCKNATSPNEDVRTATTDEKITWQDDELPAKEILDSIERHFGIAPDILARRRQKAPAHRFARYLAVYAANLYDDAEMRLSVIGRKLGITSKGPKDSAIMNTERRLQIGSPHDEPARRVLKELGLPLPA